MLFCTVCIQFTLKNTALIKRIKILLRKYTGLEIIVCMPRKTLIIAIVFSAKHFIGEISIQINVIKMIFFLSVGKFARFTFIVLI